MTFKVYFTGMNLFLDWPFVRREFGNHCSFDSLLLALNTVLADYNGECIIEGHAENGSRSVTGFRFDTEQDYLMFKLSKK